VLLEDAGVGERDDAVVADHYVIDEPDADSGVGAWRRSPSPPQYPAQRVELENSRGKLRAEGASCVGLAVVIMVGGALL